jgi:antitoxin component of MazEF toxin-antitoxin module
MPLTRKLIRVGNSRAVVIPPGWLRYYEEKSGAPIVSILMELNNVITITVPKRKREQK